MSARTVMVAFALPADGTSTRMPSARDAASFAYIVSAQRSARSVLSISGALPLLGTGILQAAEALLVVSRRRRQRPVGRLHDVGQVVVGGLVQGPVEVAAQLVSGG